MRRTATLRFDGRATTARGFDPAATGYGTGLQGMADRLDAIGGELEVRERPGTRHHRAGPDPGRGIGEMP